MKTKKITLTEFKSLIKKIIKEEYESLNEIEKYSPSIDSPEEEEELKKSWGVIEKDPYKIKDPYKTLKSDDFYDDKLKDTKLKRTMKRAEYPRMLSQNKNQNDKPPIDFNPDLKRPDNFVSYYDKYKDLISTDDDYTPARSNPINTPPVTKKNIPNKSIDQTKNKIIKSPINIFSKSEILKKDIDTYLGRVLINKQERNADTIKSAVHHISSNNSSFFPSIQSHDDYNLVDEEFKNTMKIKDRSEKIKKLKDLINNTRDSLKHASLQLMSAYKIKDDTSLYDMIKLLNDVYFYSYMLVYMERSKSKI